MYLILKHLMNNKIMDSYYNRNREARLQYQKEYNKMNKLKIQNYWKTYDRTEKRRKHKKIKYIRQCKPDVKMVDNIICVF